MRLRTQLFLSTLALALAASYPLRAEDNDALIKNAMSAAPESVSKAAAIMIGDGKGGMTAVKKGTNGFTCMPDDPTTPSNDPMCADENAMLWLQAYSNHAEPPEGKVGMAYMLQGGTTASNIDPYATAPAAGEKWLEDGPHIMIFNSKALLDVHPHETTNTPDKTQPYVMYAGSPYAHLMVPVKQ